MGCHQRPIKASRRAAGTFDHPGATIKLIGHSLEDSDANNETIACQLLCINWNESQAATYIIQE